MAPLERALSVKFRASNQTAGGFVKWPLMLLLYKTEEVCAGVSGRVFIDPNV